MRRLAFTLASAALTTTALSACALGPDSAGAADTAARFSGLVNGQDTVAACALLAPDTLADLEDSTGRQCIRALESQRLPDAGEPVSTDSYVRNARVELEGDVMFLSMFGDAWRVTAAGCRLEPGNTYDCIVKGQ